jgi:hypothetical protein
VLFKGRVIFLQYIPKKHKRFGIKIYDFCDFLGYEYDMTCNIRDAGGRRQFPANAALLTVSNVIATWSRVRLDTVAQG